MTDTIEAIAFFPWLELQEPITILGIEFLPRAIAIERAGDKSAQVAFATSYYYDNWLSGGWTPDEPRELVQIQNMAVVLVPTEDVRERIRNAAYLWTFATLFQNNPYIYANSTVFEHYFQRMGGEPGAVGQRYRRMHGSLLNGGHVNNAIQVRPGWCGKYHAPSEPLLRLLEHVVESEHGYWLQGCLEALFVATKDAENVPESLEHSLYAKAAERLLHRREDSRNPRRRDIQRERARSLLYAVLDCRLAQPPTFERVPFDVHKAVILEVWAAVRDERNAWWHPEARRKRLRAFEEQEVVHRNLIAFRAIAALVIASLRDVVGAQSLDPKLASFVLATEHWLGEIRAQDDREPESASSLGDLWSKYWMRRALGNAGDLMTRVAEAQ